jgi:hypothetical protein
VSPDILHHPTAARRSATRLDVRLDAALHAATATADEGSLMALADADPVDEHDALSTLAGLYDLHLAPIDGLNGNERWQHHPALAALRTTLEDELLERLRARDDATDWTDLPVDDAVAAMRRIGRREAIPAVYDWLAEAATYDELVEFLNLEGGPDGGFDDLVALCQVGLGGNAKLEMARNYWDEMGRGSLPDVHTELHHRLSTALELRSLPRTKQPVEALERSVVGSMLVVNRARQPEAVGALGLTELQAGPRCRRVLAALDRLEAPEDAVPFYAEHAEADPRHGKDWLDHAVAELGADPRWAEGIVRGARWRWLTNHRFFSAMADRFGATSAAAGRGHDASGANPASSRSAGEDSRRHLAGSGARASATVTSLRTSPAA